ncbi:MAG: methyltransferase [Muribaculaceae bacterium]|nr:methyltransferase [Muribaculaceae bacterium]
MKISTDSVLLGAWFLPMHSAAHTLIDAGCGSGLLSLIAAQVCSDMQITAIEIDIDAATAAKKNFAKTGWGRRLTLELRDFAEHTPNEPIDLIISNPPYFTTGITSDDKTRALARHQSGGLNYATLVKSARKWLKPDGHLGFISPSELEHEIIYEAELSQLKLRKLVRVHTAPSKAATRLLWDFSPKDGSYDTQTLYLRNNDGSFTDEYISIVQPFYTKI